MGKAINENMKKLVMINFCPIEIGMWVSSFLLYTYNFHRDILRKTEEMEK
jgi:hypothetical protein